MNKIRNGKAIIDVQLNRGYESSNGFRKDFSKSMEASPTKFAQHNTPLKASWIDTPLDLMLAVSDDQALYLLEFCDWQGLEREIENLKLKTRSTIVPGTAPPLISIEAELESYFKGSLTEFKTPLHLWGSPFQKRVWGELLRTPYGQTRSYFEQAGAMGQQTAYRAVANANGVNKLAIVIPCHRIIRNNGDVGGYGGGITRKRWLIEHEKKHLK